MVGGPNPRSRPVLFAADLFHPINGAAVQRLLDGDMRYRGRRRRSVPMLLTGRKPDHVTWPDFLHRAAPTLHPPETGRDNQRLTEWMRMPSGPSSRFECDVCATDACRVGRLEQGVNAHRSGEIVRGSLAGRLCAAASILHGFSPRVAVQAQGVTGLPLPII